MSGQVFNLSARLLPRGGEVAERISGWPQPRRRPSGRIIILVHGFNNDQAQAAASYGSFRDNLKEYVGVGARPETVGLPDVINYFWPGDGALRRIVSVYAQSIVHARQAAGLLIGELSELLRFGEPTVYFVGHSMGCRLILEILANAQGRLPAVPAVTLMAAAVSSDLVGPWSLYRTGSRRHRAGIGVLYSGADTVLRFTFPPGQYFAWKMGDEVLPYRRAIGLVGAPQGFAADQQRMKGYTHGRYWPSAPAAGEVARLIGISRPHETPVRLEEPPPRGTVHRTPVQADPAARR